MKTDLLPLNERSLALAAELIRAGETVAFPTETVYGLGADARNESAVARIFEAKGRPNDNPLIVHVADKEQILSVAAEISPAAQKLIDAFMPGPITVVMPKRPDIPLCVTGGLDTVGVRLPVHEGARRFLRACGCPIAAPSANSSGKPSPTTARHVWDDLKNKIPLILDGGACGGGVESTVISVCGSVPLLLRPGLVTAEQLTAVLGKIDIHPAILRAVEVDRAASPGMKYKHYAPRARVLVLDMPARDACRVYDAAIAAGKKPLLLWREEELSAFAPRHALPFYAHGDASIAARGLFAALRRADDEGFDTVLVTAVPTDGAGLSVMNRLLRAASFTVLHAQDAQKPFSSYE